MNTIFAYTAGYIDGDGCFYIGKYTVKKTAKTKYQAAIIISSTNPIVLQFFVSIYGGTCFLADRRIKFPTQKNQYQFCVKGNKSIELINKISPYLIEKHEEAKNFVQFVTHDIDQKEICITRHKQIKDMNLIYKSQRDYLIKYRSTVIPNEIDYAYLAGFIDAECCLSIQCYKPKNKPNSVFKIYLICNNTKEPVFQYLMERFGGHIGFVDRRSKNEKHRDQFMWRISGNALSKILPKILPYLKYKKPVCEQLVEFYKLTLPNGGDRQSISFKQRYASILQSKIDIVNKIHSLNLKGI